MNPWLIVFSLLSVLAAGVGGFKLGVDHEYAAQKREDEHIAEAVDAASSAAAAAIAKIKVVNKTIQNEVQHEIRTQTVYSDVNCMHTDAGLRGVNKALAPPGPAGDRKLPRPDAPK